MNNSLHPVTLSATALSYSYARTPALQDITFGAAPGELLCIVGPNGCGKSTLLKLLCGHLRPLSGTVEILHTPTGTAPPSGSEQQSSILNSLHPSHLARLIALVPQHASVAFNFTVREVVLMARRAARAQGFSSILGFESFDDQRIADRAMWTTDVHHLTDRAVHSLSGGERQRVTIARALAQQTPILLLDEPTAALDLWHQLELLSHLQQLAAEGRTVILVTHDLNLAHDYADRIILMDAGKIAAIGPPAEVLTPAIIEPIYHIKLTTAPALHFQK